MKLATFKIKTMCGKEIEVEAFSPCQAITIWKSSKPIELFRSCILVKSSKEIDRYYTLLALSGRTKEEQAALIGIITDFQTLETYKKFKKFHSFQLKKD